jgi:hypothetical protein
MRRTLRSSVLMALPMSLGLAVVLGSAQTRVAKTLDIYVVDVEGWKRHASSCHQPASRC